MSVPSELSAEIHKFFKNNPHQPGWCTAEKALAMAEIVHEKKPELCAEIGVFGGRSIIPVAMACRSNKLGKVVGVDPWCMDTSFEGTHDKNQIEYWKSKNKDVYFTGAYRKFVETVLRCQLLHYLSWIRARSEDAVKIFKDGTIGLLHIDGNHSVEKSVLDVELYMPKVAIGGSVVFDDLNWGSTKKAQALLLKTCKPTFVVGNCGFYEKIA